jgi:hypothetical protein
MKITVFILYFIISFQSLNAQTLEPKLYANIPTGLNILLLGYGHSEGAIPENSSLGLEDHI